MRMRVEMALLLLLLVAGSTATTEVDNLNLLLPELRDSSRALPLQLITAQGGCYSWASSAPGVVSAALLEGRAGCSKQAVVQVVRPGAYSSSCFITATDTATESVLNIPVRIRRLQKIAIATKSRMMNLKEIQKLELFAHDADENTFTSLEGLRFAWRLEQRAQIIESVPLAHAQLYLPLRTRENIEKEGFQSDILVVRALAPGNLRIIATCIEPGYEHLSDEITLSVHERFELRPGPLLRLAPASSYQLFLERPTAERIALPQAYYSVRSCPGFEVNGSLFLTVGNATSRCEIRVEDTRTIPPYSSNITVIVENPTQIRILSEPIIIVGQDSPFTVQFLNARQEVLLGIPRELRIASDFQVDAWKQLIRASKKSAGFIRASLGQLKSQLEVTALLPVRPLLPTAYLHLPAEETFKLRVVGGSGIYDYSVNSEAAVVSSLGVLVCKQPGEAQITVADRSHAANKAVIRLKVSSYASVRNLEQQKEVNREEWGWLYLIGRSSSLETFTQCLHSVFSLSLPTHKLETDKKASFSEAVKFLADHSSRLVQEALEPTSLLKGKGEEVIQSFSSYVQAKDIDGYDLRSYIYGLQNYGICEVIRFRSLVSLEERALVELQGTDSQVETKVPLRVYEPLTTTIKEDALTFLLTPLSSLTWNYTGGSYSWPNSETRILVNNNRDTNKPIIACPGRETAPISYNLRVENEQTKFLLFPTAQRSQINVTCSFPKKLELSLAHGEVFEEIYLNAETKLSGRVQPQDENGNQFYNSSNVHYHHTAETGQIEGKDVDFTYKALKKADRVKVYCENLKERVNFRRVEAGFAVSVIEPFRIDHLLFNSSDIAVEDHLRKRVQIVTLFTPKKPYQLSLKNVSPLLQLKCNESVSCDRSENRLSVNLLNIGRGWVTLRDKRVYGSTEWVFEFVIVEADEVVVAGERDYVPEGESLNVYVNNYFNGRLISPLLYEDNYLQLNIPRPLKVLEQVGNRFLVEASAVGRYEIHGEQGYPRTVRSKTPFMLTVYERIEPDVADAAVSKEGRVTVVEGETTVVIGCRRILRVKGGPKEMVISFQNDDSLLVKALPSNSFTIIGKKQGQFSLTFTATNLQETIAVIKLRVRVSVVESVELSSIDEPVVGAQFRILPRFKVGESEVEGCICDFDYKWTASKQLLALGGSNSLGFLSGGAVNATAVHEGSEVVSLVVEDKATHKTIGQAQRYIKVLKQVNLDLPTLINKPKKRTETLRVAPLTTYYFGKDFKVESKDDLLKISPEAGVEAGKKAGHSTIKLTRGGFKDELVEVEVLHVSGVFIENEDGSLGIQPATVEKVPLHLHDNHGRLFVTPLHGLPISVASSNPDVLKASLSADQKFVILEGINIGASVLTIALADRYVYDSISVSVGSQILPGAEVRVVQGGAVRFSLPNNSAGKWQSSDSSVAKVDAGSGVASAISPGKAKISNGNTFGWLYVSTVAGIEQVSLQQKIEGYRIIYKVLWQGKGGLEEIPSLHSDKEAVNNNLKLSCHSSEKSFVVNSSLQEHEGHQRLVCNVKTIDVPLDIDSYTIHILDAHGDEQAQFSYPSVPSGFSFDSNKRNIALSPSQPRDVIHVRTLEKVNIKTASANSHFVKSSFDSERGLQTVAIDMSGEEGEQSWQLQLMGEQRSELVRVSFRGEGEEHSFISLSLDWPEYLIILMAIVFGVLCFIQYYTEEKYKNS